MSVVITLDNAVMIIEVPRSLLPPELSRMVEGTVLLKKAVKIILLLPPPTVTQATIFMIRNNQK
jgi:hypothetical protein